MKDNTEHTNEENIPIDIHSGKLLDWLISRRVCDRNWPDEIQTVRKKINNAIQDMPAVEEITKLLSGSHINYFHCLRIVEILKDTEKSSKNIFGYYSSQRMKDWQEIIKLYEKNNLYLAEASQMLVRNVSYEVPSLRKQVSKLKQIQEECLKKEGDHTRNTSEFKDQYLNTCNQMGIKGDNIKSEMMELLKELPNIYTETAERCRDLEDARTYYKDFINFTIGREGINCLSVLSHVIHNGNTTVYEWKYGEPPLSVEEERVILANENDNSGVEIDFGDEINFDEPTADSGMKLEDNDTSSGESNSWGIVEMPKNEEIDFGLDADIVHDADIDFGIVSTSDLGITLESSGTDGGVAKGSEALSILDYSETRTQFLNDLLELECFLDQRLQEMNQEASMLSMNQFQNAPSSLQLQTSSNIESMITSLKRITAEMNTPKVQQLCLIKSSPAYVDRLTEALSRKLQLADKAAKAKDAAVEKRKAAASEQEVLTPKIDLIIKKTKQLQKQIEDDISKKYKNRPVNLMGGVNTL